MLHENADAHAVLCETLFHKSFRLRTRTVLAEGGMRLQESMLCIVDLSQITGKGVFQCPKCRAIISPDDKTEKRYVIIETTMNGARP